MPRFIPIPIYLCFLLAVVAPLFTAHLHAAPVIGPWEPKFKGVDLSISSNSVQTAEFRSPQVVYTLRVDLADPDIRLFTTPRHTNYVENSREVGGRTVSEFVKFYQVQAAINANFFSPPNYYQPAGSAMDVIGLAISEGDVVSRQQQRAENSSIVFDSNNVPRVIFTNWPAVSNEGTYTAVTGDDPLVKDGVNIAPNSAAEPRTAFGISQDKRYLYLAALDGRQNGYSLGASFREAAAYMILLGAYDAVAMDGGGSTTMVLRDSLGNPSRVNKSSAVADSGRERTVGSHLGIFAKPLPDFVHDVTVAAEDTYATVRWNTTRPASSQILYGTTENLGSSSGTDSALVSSHSMVLTNLLRDTDYYYKISSVAEGKEYFSPLLTFTTTNHITIANIFEVTNSWKHFAVPQGGSVWTMPLYDDSAWAPAAPALLWIDILASGPNEDVQPKGTQLPADASRDGFPYITYYFRTTFQLSDTDTSSVLSFRSSIDDGAVFYLNGSEIYRLRMPEGAIEAQTVANGYPCEGDATCVDEFTIPFTDLPSAVVGENVLAVEVHNIHPLSPDVTFGLALDKIDQQRAAKLDVEYLAGAVQLSWNTPGMTLQSAPSLAGSWTDVAGSQGTSATIQPSESAKFFRLRR